MAEMAVIGLSLKWRQLCVCSLINLGSRPMKSWKELWLLYNKKYNMTLNPAKCDSLQRRLDEAIAAQMKNALLQTSAYTGIRNPANRVILRHHLPRYLVKCTIVYFDGWGSKIPR